MSSTPKPSVSPYATRQGDFVKIEESRKSFGKVEPWGICITNDTRVIVKIDENRYLDIPKQELCKNYLSPNGLTGIGNKYYLCKRFYGHPVDGSSEKLNRKCVYVPVRELESDGWITEIS